MKEYNRKRHSVYLLTYHMIFVTKWRKPVITDEIGDFMVATARRLCDGRGELLAGEIDRDHIHLLVSLPPVGDPYGHRPQPEDPAVQGDSFPSGI